MLSSPTDSSSVLLVVTGNLDNQSALACSCVGLYTMSYLYGDSTRAQRCNHTAASVGTPFLGPNMVVKSLWSVYNVKLTPIQVLMELTDSEDKRVCLLFNLGVVPFGSSEGVWCISDVLSCRCRHGEKQLPFRMLTHLQLTVEAILNCSVPGQGQTSASPWPAEMLFHSQRTNTTCCFFEAVCSVGTWSRAGRSRKSLW